jgi:glycosyltransferase involved in cell wall biosynthesis
MCLAKPLLVSGIGGIGELVDEGVNGFHVEAESAEALAEKIKYCYDNRHLLPEMGARSKQRVETSFNSALVADNTYNLFRSIVSVQ